MDNCDRCEQHSTELGILLSIKSSVESNFPDFKEENKTQLIKMWFEQTKLDERTEMIQGFKKQNIKTINSK